FSSRRRHTRFSRDWSSDVCSSDLIRKAKNPILVKHAFTMACGMPYNFGNFPTAKEMEKVKAELVKKHGKYDIVTEVRAMGSVPKIGRASCRERVEQSARAGHVQEK